MGEPKGDGRGGQQRIPRPTGSRLGDAAPWSHLTAEQRRFTLADVRAACATLPPPRQVEAPATARPSAVLVAVFEEPASGGSADRSGRSGSAATATDGGGEARLILTKRPDTMPSHQGEIAFPGGKLDPTCDTDLRDCALREAQEEVGLDPTLVDVVAELGSMTTVAGRFLLTPFVGVLAGRPTLTRDPKEVVSVFDVAISDLLDDAAYREERWDIPAELGPEAGMDRAIHFFELPGETVWGATARILVDFLTHLTATR